MKNRFMMLSLLLCAPTMGAIPTATMTVLMLDNDGIPATGIVVYAATDSYEIPAIQGEAPGEYVTSNVTDEAGCTKLSIPCKDGKVYYTAGYELPGYYRDASRLCRFTNVLDEKWQPANPTYTGILERIQHPIPMYARSIKPSFGREDFQEYGVSYGYDIIERDWVKPKGSGKHADMLFALSITTSKVSAEYLNNNRSYGAPMDAIMTITFPNSNDGIRPYYTNRYNASVFAVPRIAPVDGYYNAWTNRDIRTDEYSVSDGNRPDANYIFRIRSGESNGPLYGKIYGPICFSGKQICFTYYVGSNANDRNLEYSGTNLFNDIKDTPESPIGP